MKIMLNGQEKSFKAPLTVSALLQDMGLGERRVAVEVNREIVSRSRHNEFQLKDNDRVEVVFAIGGGSGMSRRAGDRAARSRGPSGDATAVRDAGAPHAVVGVPSAARSRCAGPSGDAPGRPPRSGDATGEGHRPPTTGDMVLQRTLWRRRAWQ